MNRAQKEKEKIRRILKPLLLEASKVAHTASEPVCEVCLFIASTHEHLKDGLDIHERSGRYPKKGEGFLLPGAIEPRQMIPVHRLCHRAIQGKRDFAPSKRYYELVSRLSDLIQEERSIKTAVCWGDLNEAVKRAKKRFEEILHASRSL